MTRPARARIDLTALQHNLQRVRAAAPHSRVMAVIKANAYGHGLLPVAEALHSADAFAIARISEAEALREAGCDKPLLLLGGFDDADELARIAQLDVQCAIHQFEQIDLLERTPLPVAVKVWLKIDTGMHRLGIEPARVSEAVERLTACAGVAKPLRFMSHFANADAIGDARNAAQLDTFNLALEGQQGERSLANSAAILSLPASHGDWVRPGIMLYGSSPFIDGNAVHDGLRAVMTLSTHLIAVNQLRKGDAVGYGGDYVCPQDMRIGVAAIGYGDGYPRHAMPGTPVLVNGQRVPLIGRVSMDMITLDLRALPEAVAGDPVELWGEGLSIDEVARNADTISYQLTCNISARVHREYL